MTHFEGDKFFPVPLAAAAAKLSDAGFLAGTLPDAEISELTPERAAWKIKPKLAFLSGSLNVELTRTAAEPNQSVAFQVVAKAIGATSTVVVLLAFAEKDGGTAVHWTGDLTQVTGLLKMVPKGLLQGSAHKVIEEVWTAVEARLAGV
ncbi:: COXG [Gemmataceae bacterium]|jgi:carbon monoxide dehydrogenase subunit G|nr:: COXG [Gemmataceae bacterium]VTU00131.1 : COXG [Gemmataceae bacterium]